MRFHFNRHIGWLTSWQVNITQSHPSGQEPDSNMEGWWALGVVDVRIEMKTGRGGEGRRLLVVSTMTSRSVMNSTDRMAGRLLPCTTARELRPRLCGN